MTSRTIPLFPLGVVLLPQSHLPLRIFEQRYLGMVRDCTRDSSPFGVLAVGRDGTTSDATANIATVGTLAHVVDFYTTEDGLLGISTVGGARFRLQRSWIEPSGLLVGEVDILDEPPLLPLPAEFGLLATLVDSLLEHLGGHHAQADKAQRDDANWIANRLAEFLPLELPEKQRLLELDYADPKLRLLLEWLPRFQVD